jgi:hypothetical protein
LGYVVSKKGKEPDPNKVEIIVNLQLPTTVKQKQKPINALAT